MEVGLRLAEEVIDANVASDGKRLLTGLSVFPVIAWRSFIIHAFFPWNNMTEMLFSASSFLCFSVGSTQRLTVSYSICLNSEQFEV